MDHPNLSKKISELLGSDYKVGRFGNTQVPLIEAPSTKILTAANFLRFEETIRMDGLEMMSAHEKRGKLILSYFLRSESNQNHLVLRTELSLQQTKEEPSISSISEVWRMALPFEVEIQEQFGILFSGLPKNKGFVDRGIHFSEPPLRKEFVWESEFLR